MHKKTKILLRAQTCMKTPCKLLFRTKVLSLLATLCATHQSDCAIRMPQATSTSSTPFWSDEPIVLVQPNQLASAFPVDGMALSEKLNALVRLSWYIAIVLKCFGVTWYIVLLPLFTMLVTYVVHTDDDDTTDTESSKKPVYQRVFGALAAMMAKVMSWVRGKGEPITEDTTTDTSDSSSKPKHDTSTPSAQTSHAHEKDAPVETEEGFTNPPLAASLSNLYADTVQHGLNPNAPDALQHDALPSAYERYNTIGANASPKWAPVLSAPCRKRHTCTKPTPTNPFANMLVPEMGQPRTEACPTTKRIARAQNAAFNKGALVTDSSDTFAHTSGQRQFFTMPWTTTPNDPHGDFQAWLYDIEPTKKEEGLVIGKRAMGSGLLA